MSRSECDSASSGISAAAADALDSTTPSRNRRTDYHLAMMRRTFSFGMNGRGGAEFQGSHQFQPPPAAQVKKWRLPADEKAFENGKTFDGHHNYDSDIQPPPLPAPPPVVPRPTLERVAAPPSQRRPLFERLLTARRAKTLVEEPAEGRNEKEVELTIKAGARQETRFFDISGTDYRRMFQSFHKRVQVVLNDDAKHYQFTYEDGGRHITFSSAAEFKVALRHQQKAERLVVHAIALDARQQQASNQNGAVPSSSKHQRDKSSTLRRNHRSSNCSKDASPPPRPPSHSPSEDL